MENSNIALKHTHIETCSKQTKNAIESLDERRWNLFLTTTSPSRDSIEGIRL